MELPDALQRAALVQSLILMLAFEFGIGVLGALAISMLLGFAAAFGMTLACWHRTRQVRRRAIAGHCHRCDYDLQFGGLSSGCPECGWRRAGAAN